MKQTANNKLQRLHWSLEIKKKGKAIVSICKVKYKKEKVKQSFGSFVLWQRTFFSVRINRTGLVLLSTPSNKKK